MAKVNKFIALSATLIYLVLFYIFYPLLGSSYLIFSIIPIILITLSFRLWIAFIVQIIFVINRVLSLAIYDIDPYAHLNESAIIGTAANFGIILLLYYLKKLFSKLNQSKIELEKQRISELKNNEALLKLNNELVLTKEDLNKSNQKLIALNDILSEKEKRLNTIIQNQGEGFGITDFQENFIFANQAACGIFGLEKDELIGRNLRDFFDDHNWESIIQQTHKRKNNETSSYEAEITLSDENKKCLLITGSPNIDEQGNIIGTIGAFRDISDLKKAENKIKEKNNELIRYYAAIQQSSATIMFTNLDGKIEYVNSQFSTLTGYSSQEVIGKDPNILKSGKTPKKKIKQLWNTINDGKTWRGQFINKKKDGTEYFEKAIITPIKDEKNRLMGYVAVKEDVSEIRKKEKKLKQLNKKLRSTLEITQVQKEIIEDNHKDITDSINYAKTIQEALLPSKEIIDNYLRDYFILFRPKQVVGGDFYYVNKIKEYLVFAIGDCTGHGVPGSFLTMLSISYLHEIIGQIENVSTVDVLSILRERIKNTFKDFGSNNDNGLDIALCVVNTQSNKLEFSGANNPMIIVREHALIKYPGTRNPIGFSPKEKNFESTQIQLLNGDSIYLFSDGYQDQFSGKTNNKFSQKQLTQLFVNINEKTMDDQKVILEETLHAWQGGYEQIDDISILGLKWSI
jgi:PAS domain S-box-containing protein